MHCSLLFCQTLTCICEWICIVHVMWTKWCTMITMATWINYCKYLAYPRAMYGSYWVQHCEGSWLPRSEGCLSLQELPVCMSLYGISKLSLSWYRYDNWRGSLFLLGTLPRLYPVCLSLQYLLLFCSLLRQRVQHPPTGGRQEMSTPSRSHHHRGNQV